MNALIQKQNIGFITLQVFFILSFILITYASNLYVLWGFTFLGSQLLFVKQKRKFPVFLVFLFVGLIPLYYVLYGFEGGFRVLKTFVIFIPFFLLSALRNTASSDALKGMRPLHYVMLISAILVCVDFVLYLTIGRSIMSFTKSGFLPRPNGLMEDSNFFCYSMVCYIMYLKYAFGKSTKFFILSVFLSGSFSAIAIMLLMLFLYKRTTFSLIKPYSRRWYIIRSGIVSFVILFHCCYYLVVDRKDDIINLIEEFDMSPLLKIKARSMFLRFEAQKEAMEYISDNGKQLLGGGPGITKTLNERGMNLHNTYYQLYIEMGVILTSLVVILLLYYMLKIEDLSYLILFGVMSLFGNMLEVYYFPILPFIFFLYKLQQSRSVSVDTGTLSV